MKKYDWERKRKFAQYILGNNIIFPHEVEKVSGFSYSTFNLIGFFNQMPSKEMMLWCQLNDHGLVPSPSQPLSLLEIKNIIPHRFDKRLDEYSARSVKEDKISFGWHCIRMGVVPGSIGKRWEDQLRMLGDDEYVPNAAEVAWFIVMFYWVRGVKLFDYPISARTSSKSSYGNHLTIHFEEDHRIHYSNVCGLFGDEQVEGVGVAAAIKNKNVIS